MMEGGANQVPSKDEKNRRKALQRQNLAQRRYDAKAALPISLVDLAALFDFLDLHLERSGCDHTLQGTRHFLHIRGLDADMIIPWLAASGGFCDCEVLANVEQDWESS